MPKTGNVQVFFRAGRLRASGRFARFNLTPLDESAMPAKTLLAVLIAVVALWCGTTAVHAAQPVSTVVHVENMHCAHCAQKIARRLYSVPSVVRVQTNVQAGTAIVTPQAARHPSPRALWEAVEQAGFKPVRLDSPLGTFTAKPQS
jgi:copper chaperone CopZ